MGTRGAQHAGPASRHVPVSVTRGNWLGLAWPQGPLAYPNPKVLGWPWPFWKDLTPEEPVRGTGGKARAILVGSLTRRFSVRVRGRGEAQENPEAGYLEPLC